MGVVGRVFSRSTFKHTFGSNLLPESPESEPIASYAHLMQRNCDFFFLREKLYPVFVCLSPFTPLKILFFPLFAQVVLSHGQHQHLIKAKDKHGPRSTAELISSPGSVGQLLSICPNTNLLFFNGEGGEGRLGGGGGAG